MSDRLLLLIAALGLVPIALSYGLLPMSVLPALIGVDVTGTPQTHVFRAIMGLYLATAAFWLAGVLAVGLRRAALWSLLVFMAGLAFGRALSVLIDGWPGAVLFAYLLLEILFGAAALHGLTRASRA